MMSSLEKPVFLPGEAHGGVRQLLQGPYDQLPGQQQAGGDRRQGEYGNEQRAVDQEPAALPDHIVHVDVHARQSDDLIIIGR